MDLQRPFAPMNDISNNLPPIPLTPPPLPPTIDPRVNCFEHLKVALHNLESKQPHTPIYNLAKLSFKAVLNEYLKYTPITSFETELLTLFKCCELYESNSEIPVLLKRNLLTVLSLDTDTDPANTKMFFLTKEFANILNKILSDSDVALLKDLIDKCKKIRDQFVKVNDKCCKIL